MTVTTVASPDTSPSNEVLTLHFDNGDTIWLVGQPITAPGLPECKVLVRLIDWELDGKWTATAYLIALEFLTQERWDDVADGVGWTPSEFAARPEAERLEIYADQAGFAFWESDWESEEISRDREGLVRSAQIAVATARADLLAVLDEPTCPIGNIGWDELAGDYDGWFKRRRGEEDTRTRWFSARLPEGGAA